MLLMILKTEKIEFKSNILKWAYPFKVFYNLFYLPYFLPSLLYRESLLTLTTGIARYIELLKL